MFPWTGGNTSATASGVEHAGHRPMLYRAGEADARRALEVLSRNVPGLEVLDTFKKQLEGLLRARRPGRPPTPAELASEVARLEEQRPLWEQGVWVYYPWRRSVVHILDEADFVELRTSRNRYKITEEEQVLLGSRKVGVIGLSVGSQVALTLAAERSCGELRLADFDALELSNLNRLRESVTGLGLSKTTLAARAVAELDPYLRVVCYGAGVTPENLDEFLTAGGVLDVLVEECDGLDIKLRCRERARALRIPVVMEANDRATLDIERFDREPTRPLLHGLLDGLDLSRVAELRTNDEKVPYLMPMVGEATMSDELRASLLEVGESIETWPQLASDVALGAGLVSNVVRRILLGRLDGSGRYFVDLEELIRDGVSSDGANPPTEPAVTKDAARALAEEWLGRARPEAEPLPGQLELSERQLEALLEAATLAPSGANEQPWRWVLAGSELWLEPERRFGDALLNPFDRATWMALGAAAENVVLCAHQLRLAVCLEGPGGGSGASRCRFRFFEPGASLEAKEPHAQDALVEQIRRRHTNRRRPTSQPLPRAHLERLCEVVGTVPGCELRLVCDPVALAEIADVAARADRIRMLHPVGHRDLLREIRWTPEQAKRERDGVDLATLDLSPAEHAGLRMLRAARVPELLRKWRRGRSLERLTRSAVLAASAVGVITAAEDSMQSRFLAGRALQRAWLTATELGVAVQPHTAAVLLFSRAFDGGSADFDADSLAELVELRERFRRVFGTACPELFCFRAFPACEPLAWSLRRPVRIDPRGA